MNYILTLPISKRFTANFTLERLLFGVTPLVNGHRGQTGKFRPTNCADVLRWLVLEAQMSLQAFVVLESLKANVTFNRFFLRQRGLNSADPMNSLGM